MRFGFDFAESVEPEIKDISQITTTDGNIHTLADITARNDVKFVKSELSTVKGRVSTVESKISAMEPKIPAYSVTCPFNDFNSIVFDGCFKIFGTSGMSNAPVSNSTPGYLTVVTIHPDDNDRDITVFQTYNNGLSIYVRNNINNSWSSWVDLSK